VNPKGMMIPMRAEERHFPKGLPRRRLGQPEQCPLTGRMATGAECLAGCGYAIGDQSGCFVDCVWDETAIGRRPEGPEA